MVNAVEELEPGRESYARHEWVDAYERLSRADRVSPLEAEDLELLATSAYMLGRDDEYVSALERAHHGHLDATGLAPRASLLEGSTSPQGKMSAQRDGSPRQATVEREGHDCWSVLSVATLMF